MGWDIVGADTYPDTYDRLDVFNLPVSKLAAGSDLSFQVPNGVLWNVVSMTAKFTASAAVASRVINFQVKDQGGAIVYQYAVATVTASQNGTFTFSEDVVTPATFATGGNFLEPMPSTWLPPLWTFGTSTTAIDTGDTWTLMNVWVQSYLPPEGE